jgi:hypothetical protein
MSEGPTPGVWCARLEARGHGVIDDGQSVTGFTLWPDAATIITVAVEPDPTLYRQFRQRFFLCEPEPEQVFRVMGCPEAHRGRWLEVVSRQPPGYWRDFLAGPGSWLLSRLARFRRVVTWSDRGLPWDALDCPIHRSWGMEVPAAATFFAPSNGPEASRPRLLCVEDGRFADAVAACILFASSASNRDCYLADADAAEVYLAHHHEKVVISIPDAGTRGILLRELEEAGWLFRDVSGYASSIDEPDAEDDSDMPDSV